MSKRKLNRRQKWRIEKIQAEKAARADKKAGSVEKTLTTGELSPEQKGRVVAHFGQTVEIEPLLDDSAEPLTLNFASAALCAQTLTL